MNRKILPLLTAGLLLFLAAGCATPPEIPAPPKTQITLQEARSFQNKILADMGSYVEQEAVIGGMQSPIPRMAGLTCDWAAGSGGSDDISGVFLPGGYDLEVASGTDLDIVRSEIQETYAALSGWETVWTDNDGDRELLVMSPQEYKFYLSAYVVGANGNLRLDISSFSPCLEAPEGFSLFDKY